MADYICVDGPLEGRRFRWRKAPRTGEPMTVALLDVDHGVLEVDYRVQPVAGASGSGRLEFVAARDARLGRRWFGLVPDRDGGERRTPGSVGRDARAHLGRLKRPLAWVHA